MPETEAIFDEGGMAPRPESGLYGLPPDQGCLLYTSDAADE